MFGCSTFVHIHEPHRVKLDPKAKKCIFIGYIPNKRGYKRFDESSKKMLVAIDVTLFEFIIYSKSSLQGDHPSEDYWNITETTH